MYDFFFVLIPRHMPFLLEGAVVTLQISVLSMIFAMLIGLLCALGRLSGGPIVSRLIAAYVEIWRDVPLIVQLLVIFFTLPQIGLTFLTFWILLSYLVPISLFVTLEIVKFWQVGRQFRASGRRLPWH